MDNKDTSSIRVLHVLVTLNLGGAETRMMDIFRTQSKGNVVNDFVIMTDEDCYYSDEVRNAGGVIHVIENPRNNLIKALWQFYVLLRRHPKYGAVHAHTSYFSGIAVFIAWLAGIPARVTHARNKGLGNLEQKPSLMLEIGRFLCNHYATARLAITREAGKFLYGDNHAFKVVPNAFDFRSIRHRNNESTETGKREFKIESGIINLVAVARFYSVKNHKFMLKICQELKAKSIPHCIHLIGDGDLRGEIHSSVLTLDLENNVRFWGKRNDVPQLLSLFDVMIMPSISEGLGVAALEAQAAGLSCVLSTGVPEEADIGLGTCDFIHLHAPIQQWVSAIKTAYQRKPVAKEVIDKQFEDKGYAIASTRKEYTAVYR